MAEVDVVWEQTVDGGRWRCWVERLGDYTGLLTVARVADGQEIYTKEVELSYQAIFGPDVADVAEWQDLCIEAIDSYED